MQRVALLLAVTFDVNRTHMVIIPRNTVKSVTSSTALVITTEVAITKKIWINGNDPSAGSPTETLLRLHLPLNDEV